MSEREIYWGTEDTADYATRIDTDDNDRAKLLETADGDTVLLEWDGDAGEWVYGGPVNLDGADVGGVGTLDAESVDTNKATVGESLLTENGRVLPIITTSAVAKSTASTSSESYQIDSDFSAVRVGWSDVFDPDQTIALALAVRVEEGPADIRIQNASREEIIIEETGFGEGNEFLGFEDYDPPDFDKTDLVRTEYRSGDGSEITITDPLLYVGVRF